MRQTTTALVIMAALGMTTPTLAAEHTGTTTQEQMQVESHLKAAGYDVMQARQMIQAKDSKTAREMITSARNHIQMAQDVAPDTIASQIRRIESTLEQAEKMARTDMTKAGQQVAQANSDLAKLIKQESARSGMDPKEHQ